MTTFLGGTADVSMRGGSNTSWAVARAVAAADSIRTDAYAIGGYGSNNAGDEFVYTIGRGFLPFDSSAIPDAAVITAVTLYVKPTNLYDNGDGGKLCVTTAAPGSSPPVLADFDLVGTTHLTDLANRPTYASLAANVYKALPLNAAGIAAINKTGTTWLAIRSSRDVDNVSPTTGMYSGCYIATADTSGTTSDPYLEVIYGNQVTIIPLAETNVAQALSITHDQSKTLTPIESNPYRNLAAYTLTKGASGKWDDGPVYLPRWAKNIDGSIYLDPAGYALMFYTASGNTAGIDRDRSGLFRTQDFVTFERVSTDAPVLGWGPAGAYDASGAVWDGTDAAICSVTHLGGDVLLALYEGNSTANEVGDNIRIGSAFTTNSGVTWTKNPANPIIGFGANGTDAGGDTYAPIMLIEGSTIHIWFGAHSGSHQPASFGGTYGVMYGTAPLLGVAPYIGAVTWHSTSYVFKPTENIGPEQISRDADGTLRLTYANYDNVQEVRQAISNDGIGWAYDKTILSVGPSGAWDAGGVYWTDEATVNGVRVFAYTGRDAGAANYGIGVAAPIRNNAAQALIGGKVVTLSPVTETNEAQPLSTAQFIDVDPAAETNEAQALTPVKQVTIEPAVETGVAQGLDVSKQRDIDAVVESNAAQGLVVVKAVTLSPATEVGEAQALVVSSEVGPRTGAAHPRRRMIFVES